MIFCCTGIFMQAADALRLTLSAPLIGNLSQKLGQLLTYVGYGCLVYAAFSFHDPEIPLSPAAKCVLSLTSLSLALIAAIKYVNLYPIVLDVEDDGDDGSSVVGSSAGE